MPNDHFTCTTACEPTAGRLACELLRAPTLTRVRFGVSGCDGLEGEGADASLSDDAGGVGRTLGGDGDEAVALVAMDDGDGLAVAARKSPESTLTSWRTAGLN